MTAVLAMENVVFRYGERTVLDNFSVSIEAGEIVALLGPSGSGKSTVLRLVLGFAAPDEGNIQISGEVVSRAGQVLKAPEQRGLAVVFQDLALWPHLTVRGNLAFALASKKVPRAAQDQRIVAMLERLGMAEKQDKHPGQLSGGERQRVAIARALVLEPSAVLLDEPLANLDVALKRELLSIFRELLKERGATAIYVTHDLREAVALGDRIAVTEAGRVVQEGTLASLRARPQTEFVRELLADFAAVRPATGEQQIGNKQGAT